MLIAALLAVAATVLPVDARPAAAAAAATQEVTGLRIVSYTVWLEGQVLHIAGEIENTSSYRINPYVGMTVSAGKNGQKVSPTLEQTVFYLAPGMRSGFYGREGWPSGVQPYVHSIAAGGYVVDSPPIGTFSITSEAPGGIDEHVVVQSQFRNTSSKPLLLIDVVARFYDTNGRIVSHGIAELDVVVQPGATRNVGVQGPAHGSTPARAVVQANAMLADQSGRAVAWTNYFHDVGKSTLLGHIAWFAEQRITAGCSVWRFCPTGSVTREQMASFLDRALDLPATSTDFFTDDEASPHEAAINRMRAAGLTAGCTATTYCPTAKVTRAQMATFLVRAFDLPPASKDYFTDDESSTHEANINRLAASMITGGCGGTNYCPASPVTREQMAAFLHRALD